MFRLRVKGVPSDVIAEVIARQPDSERTRKLARAWDGEAFVFDNHYDPINYQNIVRDVLRDAGTQEGTHVEPPGWDADWDTFELVVEVNRDGTGWVKLPNRG